MGARAACRGGRRGAERKREQREEGGEGVSSVTGHRWGRSPGGTSAAAEGATLPERGPSWRLFPARDFFARRWFDGAMKRLFLAALIAQAVLAAPASAAVVEVRADFEFNEWRVVYDAASGERNDVRLLSVADDTIRVHDPAVLLSAGDRCRSTRTPSSAPRRPTR